MYTVGEAERLIVDEWRKWSRKHNSYDNVQMLLFFGWLQEEKSQLLSFHCHGDKQNRVLGWLQRDEDKQSKLRPLS